jgi:hypothetical protein
MARPASGHASRALKPAAAKARGTFGGGENGFGATQEFAAGAIEIVEVMVMTEQNVIDRGDLIGVEGRTG